MKESKLYKILELAQYFNLSEQQLKSILDSDGVHNLTEIISENDENQKKDMKKKMLEHEFYKTAELAHILEIPHAKVFEMLNDGLIAFSDMSSEKGKGKKYRIAKKEVVRLIDSQDMKNETKNQYYNVSELARIIRMSVPHVLLLIKEKLIKTESGPGRNGRYNKYKIHRSEVDKFANVKIGEEDASK